MEYLVCLIILVVVLLFIFGGCNLSCKGGEKFRGRGGQQLTGGCTGYPCQSKIDNSTWPDECCERCDNCSDPDGCKAGCLCKFGSNGYDSSKSASDICSCFDNGCRKALGEANDHQACYANCDNLSRFGCSSTNRAISKCQQGCDCLWGPVGPDDPTDYACPKLRDTANNLSECCNNCYMCANDGLLYDEDGNVIGCRDFVCSDPEDCQQGCFNQYKRKCTGGNPYDGGDDDCINEVVDDSTWYDCQRNCDDDEGNQTAFGCQVQDKQKCYDACCSSGYDDGSCP